MASEWYKRLKNNPKEWKAKLSKQQTDRKDNPEKWNAAVRAYRKNLRNEIYKAYGNKCWCCGELNSLFLTVDHVNNDGAKQRRQFGGRSTVTLFLQIKRDNFPNTFRLMCFNCNCGRQRNGGICPHANDLM